MARIYKVIACVLAAALLAGAAFTGVLWYLGRDRTEAAPGPQAEPSLLYDAGEFVTNLADHNARRFISVHVKLEVAGNGAVSALDSRSVVVRDRILGILRSRTYDEVSGLAGMNAVGRDIVNALNELLVDCTVLNIYFSQFIVQ